MKALQKFEKLKRKALAQGISEDEIYELIRRPAHAWGPMSSERLFQILAHRTPNRSKKAELQRYVRSNESQLSGRELGILSRYVSRAKDEPYRPSKRVTEYAKVRRRWGRIHK